MIAEMTEGTTGAMSGLPMTLHASIRAVRAAFATSFFVSRRHVVTRGTTSGIMMLSCDDACFDSVPTHWQAPCLMRHSLFSIALNKMGRTIRAARVFSPRIIWQGQRERERERERER